MHFVNGLIHYAGQFRIIKHDKGYSYQMKYKGKWCYCTFNALEATGLIDIEEAFFAADNKKSIIAVLISDLYRPQQRIQAIKIQTHRRRNDTAIVMYGQSMKGL